MSAFQISFGEGRGRFRYLNPKPLNPKPQTLGTSEKAAIDSDFLAGCKAHRSFLDPIFEYCTLVRFLVLGFFMTYNTLYLKSLHFFWGVLQTR